MGSAAAASLEVSLSGAPAFTKTGDACTCSGLAPGRSCVVTVTYTPTAPGSNDAAVLVATSPGHTTRSALNLLGTGGSCGHIYWTNYSTGTIGRAGLDGAAVTQALVSGGSNPTGMAARSAWIYWANNTGGTIGRARLDGQKVDQNFIVGASEPRAVAVNGRYVYRTNGARTASVGRADLLGRGMDTDFITGLPGPFGSRSTPTTSTGRTSEPTRSVAPT